MKYLPISLAYFKKAKCPSIFPGVIKTLISNSEVKREAKTKKPPRLIGGFSEKIG